MPSGEKDTGEGALSICLMDETNVASFSSFLAEAIGVRSSCTLVTPEYLRWKYLSRSMSTNALLALVHQGAFVAVVGSMVTEYSWRGRRVAVNFPTEWFSARKSPVRGSGRRIMRHLMDQYPLSVAVGGTDECFAPQVEVGFRDVGAVFQVGFWGRPVQSIKDALRPIVKRGVNPYNLAKAALLFRELQRRNSFTFLDERLEQVPFFDSSHRSMFSSMVCPDDLQKKWQYFMLQPCNQGRIVSFSSARGNSFALVIRFCDSRKNVWGLADVLRCDSHSAEDLLGGFKTWVRMQGRCDGTFVSNRLEHLEAARRIGFALQGRIRTQYYSNNNEWPLKSIHDFPAVSFLSLDSACYKPSSTEIDSHE